MSTAQVTGLASGIDWQQTIEQIMQIESQPMVMLQERQDTCESKLSAWQEINTKLLALKSSMEAMDGLDELLTKAATSSETNVLTASATASAATGSYSIVVNQLALNAKLTHEGFADPNTTPVTTAAATFTYTYAGEDYTVDVLANSTLTDLVQAINSDVNNPGVTATILNDGSGSNAYHLVLSGETGADNTITINDALTTLTNFQSASFTETQTAQNAQIRVDGYPPSSWIESATNEVTDIISGVTLYLKTVSATPVTVTVTNDTDAVKATIEEFVSSYNEVLSLINTDTAYDAQSETTGILFGDGSVIGIKSSLQSIISSAVPGLLDNAHYKSLSEIGIKSGSGGLLSITDSKLTDALETDFNAVGNLFAFTSSSTNNSLTYFTRTTDTQGGTYNVVADYDAGGTLLSATINGNPTTIDGNYIIASEGYPEGGLRIQFTYPGGGAGSVSAEVRLGTGASVEIGNKIAFLTDPIDGTVHYAQEGIQDTIDSLEKQIEDWEDRLAITQAQLERNFLAMETLISQLQGQGNYLSAQLSNL